VRPIQRPPPRRRQDLSPKATLVRAKPITNMSFRAIFPKTNRHPLDSIMPALAEVLSRIGQRTNFVEDSLQSACVPAFVLGFRGGLAARGLSRWRASVAQEPDSW
jgi:hypothetical protein